MGKPIDANMIVESKLNKEGIRFYNIDNEPFSIHGIWRDGDRYYRVPRDVAKEVSANIYDMCHKTAGGRVRFCSDSSYVAIRAHVHNVEHVPVMTILSSAGFDLYADNVYAGSFIPQYDQLEGVYEAIVDLKSSKNREFTIHFPLYTGVYDLHIGIDENASLTAAKPYGYDKPVVYYGSSITNGASASRPGMTYEAQISRTLNIDHHNLGFGGAAKGELPMAEYVAGLDMCVFVYDYDHNAPTVEYLDETHERMFKIVREKNPDLPIIIISRPAVIQSEDRDARFAVIKKTYDNAVAAGDKNVYLIPGWEFFDGVGNDYTTDNCHPTDLGFFLMAKGIADVLKKLI